MDLSQFLINLPTVTRERHSDIKETLDAGKIYVTAINKNNKKHFKLYYKDGGEVKTKQLKVTAATVLYISQNLSIVTLSDTAQKLLD